MAQYNRGLTPNPDILCNMKIKFDAFLKHAIKQNNSHFLATGHYAQTLVNPMTGLQLGTAHDPTKDQTYFLAGLGQDVLSRVCFPVGNLSKRQVKDIAVHAGFTNTAERKESMGICFIGKRNFPSFISEYIDQQPGLFVGLDGATLGQHNGSFLYTIGQRSRVKSLNERHFVIGKDLERRAVVLARVCFANRFVFVPMKDNALCV